MEWIGEIKNDLNLAVIRQETSKAGRFLDPKLTNRKVTNRKTPQKTNETA